MDDKLKTTARRRALSERNKTAVMLICYPVWTLLILLPIHALLLSLEATFRIDDGHEAWQGAAHLCCNPPQPLVALW